MYYAVVVLIGAILSAAIGITQLATDATRLAGWFFGLFVLLLMASFALEWLAAMNSAV